MIQAAWRGVECSTCGAKPGERCGRGGMIHVARIAAGKIKAAGKQKAQRKRTTIVARSQSRIYQPGEPIYTLRTTKANRIHRSK